MEVGNLLKFVPGAAVLAGVLGTASYFGWGPYGVMQPRPPECAASATCVIVAGIDGDVHVGPGAGNQPFGFDIEDEAATRLVLWLARSKPDGLDVQVYKYPSEIEMPATGVRPDPAIGRNALRRAREIGKRHNARLVVIGSLSGNSVSVAFINPNSTYPELSNEQLGVYDISSVEWPDRFQEDYRAALLATFNAPNENVVVLPTPMDRHRAPPPVDEEVAEPEVPATNVPVVLDPEPLPTPPTAPTTPSVITPARYNPPQARWLNEAHPERAYARGVGETVHLRCRVTARGDLVDCRSTDTGADPWRFRPAAINLAQRHMSGEPQRNDGVAVETGTVDFEIVFPRPPRNN